MKHWPFFFLLFAIIISSCSKNKKQAKDTLFDLVSSEHSGIDFINQITTDDSINILNYEYLYNGGGVGVGDFNNDSLPDIFFTGNMLPCRLYINKGNLQFADLTEPSTIDTRGVWAYGVSVIDINQDGWQDIYLSAGGMGNKDAFPNKLYINQGDLTFKESAKEYGLADPGESIQAAFFDYDRDGDLDMYLLTGGGFERPPVVPRPILKDGTARNTDRLYRNDFDEEKRHPFFTNVSKDAGIVEEGFGLGIAILDVNEDGWPDVYVTNDYLTNDLLYINNQDGTFSEKAALYFKHTSHFAMGNDAGDINNDGLIDIVALDMLPEDYYRRKLMFGPNQYDRFYFSISQGYSYQYMRNTLQLNNGNGSFSEIGQLAGIHKTDWSWAVLLADLDNDAYKDIFITNGFGKDVTDLDFVKFRNEASQTMSGGQIRKAYVDSLNVRPGIHVPNYAYKNNRDYTFSKVSERWGFDMPSYSNGAAYADFDRDGDLDLVVNNIDKEAFLYRNNLIEKKIQASNFLRIKLIGPLHNRSALGAKVELKYDSQIQVGYHQVVRGFESSCEDVLHFGLGSAFKIDTVLITWPDGQTSKILNVEANQVIYPDYSEVKKEEAKKTEGVDPLFRSVASSKFNFKHIENEFNDFNRQALLLHKLSQEGPGIAVSDINGDGLEDFFVGSGYGASPHFFVQQKGGTFIKRVFDTEDDPSEDLGCILFDADGDGDEDLYVVSGGNEFYVDHKNYQDRLYKNDGRGNFKRDNDALPNTLSSGSSVVACDYDRDGDLDLFIGGRVVPNAYPTAPRSYLLQNNKGKFIDVTEDIAPGLSTIGMITSALWTDHNNDNAPDLIVVGEAMPLTVFENHDNKFSNVSASLGLNDTEGFWNSIVAGDLDNDGDTDYIAGNAGLNGPYKASPKEPITIHHTDFDNNGSVDPLVAHYENGQVYPAASLDILTQQIPSLKKRILFYRNFARASMTDILNMTGKKEYKTLYCKTLKTSVLKNNGSKGFEVVPLPVMAQTSPVYGMVTEDVNLDGNLDILLVGNSYVPDVVTGRHDAFIGLVLAGDGKGNLSPIKPRESGFFIDGDAKGMVKINIGNESHVIVTQNNDSLSVLSYNKLYSGRIVEPKKREVYAMITFNDGRKRKIEFSAGHTYLSQSSNHFRITDQTVSAEFFNKEGKSVRKLSFRDR